MGKLIHIRKPRLRLTSKGVKITRPSARIGGRVGVNLSSRGARVTVHTGRRRRRKSGCLPVLLLPLLALVVLANI